METTISEPGLISNKPATILDVHRAIRIADDLENEDDNGWQYRIQEMANDKAMILVFDETGFEVGRL